MNTKPHTSNSYALITGAASGMGREYARKLYALGHNLILVDKNGSGLKEVEKELSLSLESPTQPHIFLITKDLSKVEAAEKVYELVKEKEIDILINNAGIFQFGDFTDTPLDKISEIQILHNFTPVRLCALFSKGMKERGHGYILNVSSLAAWMPFPGFSMYGATKRFVKSYSRSLRVELRGSGVSVTTAYFGGVSTNLFNLSEENRKLALKLGIFITAEKASRCALNAMFRKRSGVLPGAINWIAFPFFAITPNWLHHIIYKKFGHLLKGL